MALGFDVQSFSGKRHRFAWPHCLPALEAPEMLQGISSLKAALLEEAQQQQSDLFQYLIDKDQTSSATSQPPRLTAITKFTFMPLSALKFVPEDSTTVFKIICFHSPSENCSHS